MKVRLSLSHLSAGYIKNRFHPTDSVLACGSDGQVTILKAANRSVPFCNWRIEWELIVQNVKQVSSLEWNVSYFTSTQITLFGL